MIPGKRIALVRLRLYMAPKKRIRSRWSEDLGGMIDGRLFVYLYVAIRGRKLLAPFVVVSFAIDALKYER